MDHFTSGWLAQRESADAEGRSSYLTRVVSDRLASETALHALDIATGSGANVRYLIEHLPPHQSWLLVDVDPVLLGEVPARMRSWGARNRLNVTTLSNGLLLRGEQLNCRLVTSLMDVATDLDKRGAGIFSGCRFVTASALLDLVSERWLHALARRCHQAGAVVLFALSYDGRIDCSPKEPEDPLIQNLVNAHHQTDRGFGPALGTTASVSAAECLAGLGYDVLREPSDWILGPDRRELQQQLIDRWADAAVSLAPGRSAVIRSWQARRLAHVSAGHSRLIVGHQDVAGWLA